MDIGIHTLDGASSDKISLSDAVFGLEPRADILQRVVRWQLAKRQAGTHRTKPRSEIARTGAKFGRQKGGGGARHGSRRSGIFVGGGKSHGPVVRDHSHDLPKKVRALGLKHALSSKAKGEALIVLDKAELSEAKTQALRSKLEKLNISNAVIISGTEIDRNFMLAARNIPNIDVLPVQGANVYDILRRHTLILTKDALQHLEERLS
jgi:large subunit ribosomal protein L4